MVLTRNPGISHLLDIPARPDKPKRRDRPTIAARSASVRPHAAASRTVQTGMCRRSTAGFSVASRALNFTTLNFTTKLLPEKNFEEKRV